MLTRSVKGEGNVDGICLNLILHIKTNLYYTVFLCTMQHGVCRMDYVSLHKFIVHKEVHEESQPQN